MFSGSIQVLVLTFHQGEQSLLWKNLNAELVKLKFQFTWSAQLEKVKADILADLYDVILLDFCEDMNWAREVLLDLRTYGCEASVISVCEVNSEGRNIALDAGASDYLYCHNLGADVIDKVVRHNLTCNGHGDYYAQHDPLTGTPNRLLFVELFSRSLSRMRNMESRCALFYIEIDRFRQINEAYGSQLGDLILKQVSQLLTDCLNEADYLARIGGDEFAIVIEQIPGAGELTYMAEAIADVLALPLEVGGRQLNIGFSMGIATYPESGETVDELLHNSTLAAEQAKPLPGSSYRFYDEQISSQAKGQLYREADLRRGLRNDEFILYYQPRIDLKTGKITGVEALLRWQHAKRGLLSPDEFIPLAEQTGLIQPLGYWVLYRACKDVHKLRNKGLDTLDIAVNLSFKQFQDEHFVAKVMAILDKYQVSPSQLEFELTETTIMDNDTSVIDSMEKLVALGSTFSLDDFGTGFSSFAHIQRLPISALKIDRSFVKSLHDNQEDADMVRAMVAMSHSLGMQVVAEGAELKSHIDFLRQVQCDQVQGHYCSRPISISDLIAMLSTGRHKDMAYI